MFVGEENRRVPHPSFSCLGGVLSRQGKSGCRIGVAAMAMVTGTPSGGMDQRQFLSELSIIQKSMFDQSSNYTKLILGLGYAGFFGAWAGTRANLRRTELVGSALLICLSLFAYIIFEILQARFLSRAAIDFGRTLGTPGLQVSAVQQYQERTAKAQELFFKWWSWVFHFSAITGLLGALILIVAFIRFLWRMT